jgi:Ca2+-binding RTX toxin-like protein
MANFTIKGEKHSVINLEQSNSTWTILANATVSVTNSQVAIFEDSDRSGNTLINNGHVFDDDGEHSVSIELDGEATHFTNSATGVVTGLTGVRLLGDHQNMVNQGLIDVSEEGVKVYGKQSSLTNHGKIFADGTGVDLINCSGSTIINADDGKIKSSDGTGVSFSTDTDVTVKFINEGSVTSKFDAVSGSNGNDKVVNHGTLSGNVNLGDGDNLFDTRQGTFNGSFIAGDGDDTLITDKASIKFSNTSDTDGFDTVESTVSYTLNANVERLGLLGKANINATGNDDPNNYLYGNAGNNILNGHGGYNELFGMGGTDTLIAGPGVDLFGIGKGYGHDTVKGYTDEIDGIDIYKLGPDNFDELKSHIHQHGSDTWIDFGKDVLILKGIDHTVLNDTDFVFNY